MWLQVAETQKDMLINNDGHITATNMKLASVAQESTFTPFLKTNYDCKYVSFLTDNFTKHEKVNSYCEYVLFDLSGNLNLMPVI